MFDGKHEEGEMAQPPISDEDVLLELMRKASKRLNDIADLEAKQAEYGAGPAARGELIPEKNRLIATIDGALEKLEKLYAQRP
jgi:hypothetical protein